MRKYLRYRGTSYLTLRYRTDAKRFKVIDAKVPIIYHQGNRCEGTYIYLGN